MAAGGADGGGLGAKRPSSRTRGAGLPLPDDRPDRSTGSRVSLLLGDPADDGSRRPSQREFSFSGARMETTVTREDSEEAEESDSGEAVKVAEVASCTPEGFVPASPGAAVHVFAVPEGMWVTSFDDQPPAFLPSPSADPSPHSPRSAASELPLPEEAEEGGRRQTAVSAAAGGPGVVDHTDYISGAAGPVDTQHLRGGPDKAQPSPSASSGTSSPLPQPAQQQAPPGPTPEPLSPEAAEKLLQLRMVLFGPHAARHLLRNASSPRRVPSPTTAPSPHPQQPTGIAVEAPQVQTSQRPPPAARSRPRRPRAYELPSAIARRTLRSRKHFRGMSPATTTHAASSDGGRSALPPLARPRPCTIDGVPPPERSVLQQDRPRRLDPHFGAHGAAGATEADALPVGDDPRPPSLRRGRSPPPRWQLGPGESHRSGNASEWNRFAAPPTVTSREGVRAVRAAAQQRAQRALLRNYRGSAILPALV
eukprot:TRINITY_DN65180_c0_g1_i1.p1 TRINITY_DN65180_c0_g1~~TRINITY_DN65180_c0_g1_i1.p1  ORF type:complete len:479 (+),score=45.48 TRINITY_DN65180_c0_g1_i1:85-1521(+)